MQVNSQASIRGQRKIAHVPELAVNPPSSDLGRVNALLRGRARRYEYGRFAAPLSIKTVIEGSATWEIGGTRYEVTPGSALLVNDDEEYSIEVDALQPVETFCVFFARGFVEDAFRSATTSSARLLEHDGAPRSLVFAERWQFDPSLLLAIEAVHAPSDAALYELANVLVRSQIDVAGRVARLPLVRASTRDEIRRRVERGVAYIHANIDSAFTVADVAREACLSRFHFHRLFTSLYGETPHRYIARIRLEHARALLRDRNRSIADVAYGSGFATPSAFSTAFAKHFGAAPRAMRKSNFEKVSRAGEA
jgi:AraC-like DNA-binding protein